MVMLSSHKDMGALRIYDVRRYVNLTKLIPAFERLVCPRPSCKSNTSTLRARQEVAQYERLIECGEYVIVAPDNQAIYPSDFDALRTLQRCVEIFAECADAPDKARVLLQMQRTVALPRKDQPWHDDWHRRGGGVSKLGVICVTRNNVVGGMNEFRNQDGQFLARELSPGFMAIFRDDAVVHRVAEVVSEDDHHPGERDVLIMSF
jgi:hypothetical protein